MDKIAVLNYGFSKPRNSWQGWQYDDRTIADETEIDVKAIRELLDEEQNDRDEEGEQ